MKEVFLYGDSHATVFQVASEKEDNFKAYSIAAGRMIKDFALKTFDNEDIYSPILTTALQRNSLHPAKRAINKQAKIVLLFGTGEGLRQGLFPKWDDYYFLTPNSNKNLMSNKERGEKIFVCYTLVRGFFEHRLTNFFKGVQLFVNDGYKDIAIMACPPPHSCNKKIVELFNKKHNTIDSKLTLASEKTRHHLHYTAESVVQSYCQKENIKFISNIPEIYDEKGFLAQEYERDGIHANTDYAVKMISHIKTIM